MQILNSYTSFTPANSESVTVNVPSNGRTFALPDVDPDNVAMSITNAGSCAALLNFGTSATIPARPDMPGLFLVPPNSTVVVDGPLAAVVETATYAAAAAAPGATTLTFVRGTVAAVQFVPPSGT